MIDVAIMIEGQNGLTWERWKRIAEAVEALGFAGLYRSDHFTNAEPPDIESLECWVSLAWLASHTRRIEFGPLVSPLSFRQPTMLVRQAAAVDDLSGGRLTLGVGAGWQEREHTNYGWALLAMGERFERFEEGLEIITRLARESAPVTVEGRYYAVRDAVLLPRPQRRIPILIGGNGMNKTLPFAARYADEWNGVFLTPTEFRKRNERLNVLLEESGRERTAVRRSMMTGTLFGRDDAEVRRKAEASHQTVADARGRGMVAGTPEQFVDQLGALSEAGLQRVMLQWLDLDDLDGLEAIGARVLPHLK